MSLSRTCFYLCILITLLYLPGIHNPLDIDTASNIQQNKAPYFESLTEYFTKSKTKHYSPLYYLINTTLAQHFSAYPWFFRLLNVFLFCLNSSLLLVLLNRLFSLKAALLAVLFFSIHPVNTEILHNTTTNAILLMSILMILSLLWLDRSITTKKKSSLYLSYASYIVALFCLEFSVSFPFYVCLLLFFKHKLSFKKICLYSAPYFCFALGLCILWKSIAGAEAHLLDNFHALNIHLWEGSAMLFQLLSWYLSNLIRPESIVFIYNIPAHSVSVLGFNILFLSFAALVVFLLLRWRRNEKSFALLWFLISLLLFVPASLGHSYMGMVIEPHWLFFGSIGLFMLAALIMEEILPTPTFLKKLAVSFFIAYFTLFTSFYIYLQNDKERHIDFWFRTNPSNYIALFEKGYAETTKDNFYRAFIIYNYAAQLIDFQDSKILNNIAKILQKEGKNQLARKYLKKAVAVDPNNALHHHLIGVTFAAEGNLTEAQKSFEKAIALDPNRLVTLINLADSYTLQEKYAEALSSYGNILKNPYASELHEEAAYKIQMILDLRKEGN